MMKLRAFLVTCALAPHTIPALAQVAPGNVPEMAKAAPVIVEAAQLSARPRFISGKQPDDLPEVVALAAQGRFGKVAANATVLASGMLADIELVQPSGDAGIDAGIIAVLKTWRLTAPVDKAGNKVATKARFPFTIGRGPKQLSGGEAEMPQNAKLAFHNGKVVVNFRIDPEGVPVDVKVLRSSKSDLLDNAVLSAIADSRFDKPKDLQGRPASYDAQISRNFSQAEQGTGSYIGGVKSYRCDTFIGELDWWTAANPEAKPATLEFYAFMGGLSFVAPEALGWGKFDLVALVKRHPIAWDRAVEQCRKEPGSRFLEQYKKG